jgi:hypothetical protein
MIEEAPPEFILVSKTDDLVKLAAKTFGNNIKLATIMPTSSTPICIFLNIDFGMIITVISYVR